MRFQLEELDRRTVPAAVLSMGGFVSVNETTHDPTGAAQTFGLLPFEPSFHGPANTALVDHKLVAAGAGAGGGPRVVVYARAESAYVPVFDEFVFEPSFRGGVNVALADVNGDLQPDLVVGAGPGGGPRVRTFLNDGGTFVPDRDFFAFEDAFRGGVFVDGLRDELVVTPGPGGGPRVQRYLGGDLVDNRFVLDPADRSVVDWAYGKVAGQVRLEGLASDGRLLTFDHDLAPVGDVAAYHKFTAIGIGDYVDFDATGVMAVAPSLTGRGQVDALVVLDEVLGIPLSHIDFPSVLTPGNAQVPDLASGPPPDETFDPLNLYRDATPAVYQGVSIGRQGGTGTYTITARDNATGAAVGLTNQHVAGGYTDLYQPGPVDSRDGHFIGSVLRTSNADVDVAVFSLAGPFDPSFRILYFDAFAQRDTAVTLPLRYDPTSTLAEGDVVYKIGRTTALTRGVVDAVDVTLSVGYPDGVRQLAHQVLVAGTRVALPGDSGSPVFVLKGGEAWLVAQLFAGSPFHGVVTPIGPVFAAAGVSFLA